jgi:hypothetical protein
LSGLAEAMASGADEAIAYDTLAAAGKADDWPKVLSLQMRLRSIGSIITLTIGALVYDPNLVNQMLTWFGTTLIVDQQTTMRFPVYLTLIMALFATMTAFRMEEKSKDQNEGTITRTIAALRLTWKAGLWIAKTPFALTIILIGMCYDHILRMIVTMTSQYFRLIHLPEASFGVIGSTIALLGLVVPKIAEYMIEKNSPTVNMYWVTGIGLIGLFGLTGFFPYWGLLPMALIFIALMCVSFFTSHYLNRITESHQRATVLSFKGMAFNLAYGWIGFGFALLIGHQRTTVQSMHPAWSESAIEILAFIKAIGWFPWYTIICLGLTLIYCRYRLRGRLGRKQAN